mmetsp:Transcript_17862/g.54664  ORF Transcript_17862/g.54664 Transcript_17862/m.54664 type:complete len:309 (+) Transcript_17862:601-1527(+)
MSGMHDDRRSRSCAPAGVFALALAAASADGCERFGFHSRMRLFTNHVLSLSTETPQSIASAIFSSSVGYGWFQLYRSHVWRRLTARGGMRLPGRSLSDGMVRFRKDRGSVLAFFTAPSRRGSSSFDGRRLRCDVGVMLLPSRVLLSSAPVPNVDEMGPMGKNPGGTISPGSDPARMAVSRWLSTSAETMRARHRATTFSSVIRLSRFFPAAVMRLVCSRTQAAGSSASSTLGNLLPASASDGHSCRSQSSRNIVLSWKLASSESSSSWRSRSNSASFSSLSSKRVKAASSALAMSSATLIAASTCCFL